MTKKISLFLISAVLVLPITLITGPAIPDITITISGIFFLFLSYFNLSEKRVLKEKIFIYSVFFWICLNFISLFAENILISLVDSLIFIRILIIPIFLYYWVFSDLKNLEKVISIIFFTVIFVCIDSLYQFTQYDPLTGFGKDLLGFSSNWYGRLTGPFYNELIPGAYVSKLGLIGLIYLFLKVKNLLYQNLYSIIYLTLIGVITFISGERMALATFLLGLFFLFIFYNKKRLVFFYSIIFIILLNLIIYKSHPIYNDFKILKSSPDHLGLVVEKNFDCIKEEIKTKCNKIINLQPSFFEIITNFDKSAYGKIYYLSWKMFLDHKITGIGLNNFNYLCNKDNHYKLESEKIDCKSHPHNIYIQWLVETGITGTIIFIVYLILIINLIIKNSNTYNKLYLISLSSIIIIFWPIMSTGSLLKNWNGVSVFFIIGVCLALNKLKYRI